MQFINRWAILVILEIGILLISGCFSVDEPPPKTEIPVLITKTEIAPLSPTATPVSTESNLSLQLGFSDENILLASSQGFKLQTIRISVINGQPYTAFYLSRHYQSRVMNDFATTVLIYEGDLETIGNFVYRIEIREPIDPEQIFNLPTVTGWSNVESAQILGRSGGASGIPSTPPSLRRFALYTSLPFSSKVTTGYEAAGFSLKAIHSSVDTQGGEYFSIMLHLYDDLYYALTFERSPGSTVPKFLEVFPFPPDNGQNLTYYHYYVANFDKWLSVPKSRPVKALYALGCGFIRWNPSSSQDGNFSEEQLYEEQSFTFKGKSFLLVQCVLPLLSPNGQIFISMFVSHGQGYKRLWNAMYPNVDILLTWGDVNGDQVPDLVVSQETPGVPGSINEPYILGTDREVFQLTSTGDLIDLLFGVDEAIKVDGSHVEFNDLDGDSVAEIVVTQGNAFLYGGPRLDTFQLFSISNIYQLQDGFYYLPAKSSDFAFLCRQAINEFVTQTKEMINIKNRVYDAYITLEACKAVGMEVEGWDVVKSDLENLVNDNENSLGCRRWVSAVHDSLARSMNDTSFPSTDNSTDWNTLYWEADCN